MCIIAACPAGKTPTEEHLAIACVNNPDGFGWAIAGRKTMTYHRTMNADEAVDTFLSYRKQLPQSPAMFHARIATHSAVNLAGCHPFAVGHDERIMLAHNGMLHNCEPGPFDHRSDSAVLAEDVIPANGGIDSLTTHTAAWGQWIGRENKLVVLASVPGIRRMTIINETSGQWDSGIWWSNAGYEYAWTRSPWSENGAAVMPIDDSWRWDKCGLCMVDSMVSNCEGLDLCRHCQAQMDWPNLRSGRQYCDECGCEVPGTELTQRFGQVICKDCDWDGYKPPIGHKTWEGQSA